MHQIVFNFVTKVYNYNLIFLYASTALTANICKYSPRRNIRRTIANIFKFYRNRMQFELTAAYLILRNLDVTKFHCSTEVKRELPR